MESVPEHRHRQAAQACLLLQRLPAEGHLQDWAPKQLESREQGILNKLEELCAPEILAAILGNWMGAGLCGIYVAVVEKPPYTVLYLVREDLAPIYGSIRRAAGSVAASGKQFHEHVEDCMARTVARESTEEAERLRGLKTRFLLELLSTVTLNRARFILAFLDEDQRRDLSRQLYRELGNKPRPVRMDTEPKMPAHPTLKQRYGWLHWYLWRSFMHRPEVRHQLGGVSRISVIVDGDRMLKNRKTGKFSDPLGPIHAKVWPILARELNKHGHPIKDPESKRRFAASMGVSRSTFNRYEAENAPVKISLEGKARVKYELTMNDVLRSLEIASRKRPANRKKGDA